MQEFHLETIGPSGDCAVLQVTGEIDVYTAPILRERIRDLAAKGAVHIIADLSRVDFLDSTGLGVLVGGLKRLREHDGSLTPVISTTRILRILEVTGVSEPSCSRSRLRPPTKLPRPGGSKEVHAAQVGNDVHGALGGQVLYSLAQDRRGVDVDLSGGARSRRLAAPMVPPGGIPALRLPSSICHELH